MDANVPVEVRPANAGKVEARIRAARNEIQRRAWERYCGRGGSGGCALGDWTAAERELAAAPIASVTDEGDEVRVTACVSDAGECDLVVEVLTDEIVVEAERDGEIRRFTRIHLPAQVDARDATARLRGMELIVVARKADVALQ